MHRVSTHVIAFSLGVLALGAFTNHQVPAPPPTPSWVTTLCTDASPCDPQLGQYQGLAIAIQWLMPDPADPAAPWVECPGQPSTHPQNGCVGGAEIAYWIVKTEGDVGHGGNAIRHDVDVVTDSPIYSAQMPNWPNEMHALGAVVALGLPPTAATQAPQLPVLDPIAWQLWFDAACANHPTCGTGVGWDEARVAALEARMTGAETFNGTHVHDVDPAMLTIAGSTVTTTVGR